MSPYPRRLLFWAALAYSAFVIYGSLVPLDFRPLPPEEALARFRAIPYLQLGIGSRADWVANILLFLPLAFLWLGVLWHRWHWGWRLAASLTVLAGAVLFSLALEFTQLFFPPRTVSLNDVLAETLGALAGVALWWMTGPRLVGWVQSWREAHGPLARQERLLALWLAGLFLYNVLPLDLTISPVEVYHKFREGRVVLVPFTGLPRDPVEAFYQLLADVAVWIPAARLWHRAGAGFLRTVANTVLAAALLEFLQLWVFSRVTDVTDVFTAALGGLLGAGLARRSGWTLRPVTAAGLLALWAVVLALVFWYPFDFRSDGAFLSRRVAGLARVPFTAYYFGTEYRAATEVLHKLLFFLPVGWLAVRAGLSPPAALVLGACAAAAVETGQLFLPGKNADVTDWIIESLGAAAGVWLAGWLAGGVSVSQPCPEPSAAPRGPALRQPLRPLLLVAALAVGFLLLARLPFVPYNVRELLGGAHPVLSALGLALAVVWIVGFPAWLAKACAHTCHLRRLAAAPLLHGLIAFVLLRLAVPLESFHDVVGSPTLNWPGEWEIAARFLGLFAAVSAAALPAACLALGAARPAQWLAVALAVPLLAVSYAVVVLAANTDNLTELLAHSARWDAFLWVWLAGFVTALAGYGLAAWLGGHRVRWLPWMVVGSAPLAWGLLALGLEPTLVKYGQVFSALQFLLSADRAHYAGPGALALRFLLAWGLTVAVTAGVTAALSGPGSDRRPRATATPAPRPRPAR